jgi:hypothetical protein
MTKSAAILPYKITTIRFVYSQPYPNHHSHSHFLCDHFEEMAKAASSVGNSTILFFIIRRPYPFFTSIIEQLASTLHSLSTFSIATKVFRESSELGVALAIVHPADF